MNVDLTSFLIEKKKERPEFVPDETFLLDLGKELSMVYPNDGSADYGKIEDGFHLLISRVFDHLSMATLPFDSKEGLYFLMMQRFYQFAREKKLSALLESYACYLTFRKDVYRD